MNRPKIIFLLLFLGFTSILWGQTSPLSKGKWAKIGTSKQGIYKLTGAQLTKLGFTLPIVSSQLQLFGFNLNELKEKVSAVNANSLTENAIKVWDGGDGQIEANDYILFYNQGAVSWKFDSAINRVSHKKVATGDSVYYFLTIGQNGKRVVTKNVSANTSKPKNYFSQYTLFEKDSISLLNSGKVFWGDPMGQGIGKQNALNFSFNASGFNNLSTLKSYINQASTSYQVNGQFDYVVNNELIFTSSLPVVSGLLFDDIASMKLDSFQVPTSKVLNGKNTLKLVYNNPNNSATGWLDYIELHFKKPVGFWQDSVINFSLEDAMDPGVLADCAIQDIDSTALIWDVTNLENPSQIQWQTTGQQTGHFLYDNRGYAEFFGVRQSAFEVPILMGQMANQNVTNINEIVDYVIVAAPAYLNAAQKYQQFQLTKFGRKTIVVNARELYNDFSGGQASAVAIRNFLKYLFNQSLKNNTSPPKYLMLLGIGNHHPKLLNLDFELPVYESVNSTSIISSYTTDDFYAMLNTGDDINNYDKVQTLNLSVGRIPARSIAEADTAIQKLMHYQNQKVGGAWENKITWVADDGDYNLHIQDAEAIIEHLQSKANNWNHQKIYLDLFPAVNTSAGNTYPLAFNAIQQSIQEGSLVLNYTGHGNYLRLSEEAVISQSQFDSWRNANRLPLMITASCNFTPYDQPKLGSIAWDAFMKNSEGIIGLVAANRLVYAYSNKKINDLFIQQLLVKTSNGKYQTIGDALQKAKLLSWAQNGDRLNDLKFNLMGDPAMTLNFPENDITIHQINEKPFKGNDTLSSGTVYKIIGSVNKNKLTQDNFSGVVNLIIYDAVKYKKTLANQSTSMSVPIATQESILFRGKATVTKGNFKMEFILPSQISNPTSPIRIELAATAGNESAILIVDSIFIKSDGLNKSTDTIGPGMKAYLNEPLFKQGGWAKANSTLFIDLTDSSGIQTSGNALGHDLALWVDNEPIPIILNNYFSANLDTYQSGKVEYLLPTLSEGSHRCIIKSWDLLGNSNTDTLTFTIPKSNIVSIINPTNYPNPFFTKSRFSVETNKVGIQMQISFDVLDPLGNIIYTYNRNFVNTENRINVDWDGISSAGSNVKPGVYHYRFAIKTEDGSASLSNTFIKL